MPPETTQIDIRLNANGDAAWTITTRLDATTEEEKAAFSDLANQYESGQKTPPWLDRVRAAAAASSDASGRQMNVTDERFTSDVNSSTMTLRFTWTNFARDQGDHMVIDDAFNTTRGTWLDGLTENQELDHRITGRLRSRQRSQGGPERPVPLARSPAVRTGVYDHRVQRRWGVISPSPNPERNSLLWVDSLSSGSASSPSARTSSPGETGASVASA